MDTAAFEHRRQHGQITTICITHHPGLVGMQTIPHAAAKSAAMAKVESSGSLTALARILRSVKQ